MNYYKLFLLVFLGTLSFSSHFSQNSEKKPQFIILSNVGSSNYFSPPILISTKKIDKVDFKKGDYYVYQKYNGFGNFVVDESCFLELKEFLNVTAELKSRDKKSLRETKAICIIDYRDELGNDGIYYSIQEVNTVLFVLKQIEKLIIQKNMNSGLEKQLKFMINHYYKTYGVSKVDKATN